MPGRPKKFNPRHDPHGLRLPGAKKPPGPIKTLWLDWQLGRRVNKSYRAHVRRTENSMAIYDPKKSVAAGGKQAANTVGSGSIGAVVAGVIYGLLPDSMDEQTKTAIAGAGAVIATVGTSYLWGWWRNRAKHT